MHLTIFLRPKEPPEKLFGRSSFIEMNSVPVPVVSVEHVEILALMPH
jgi:hypothetical protein